VISDAVKCRVSGPLGAVLLAAGLAGCAGGQRTTRGDEAAARISPSEARADSNEVSTRAKLLFEDAIKAFEAQKKARALDYPMLENKFQAALDEDPKLAEAEYNLGVLAERQGKRDVAAAHYRAALKRKPTLKEAAENLAVMAQNEGRIPEAVRAYEGILETHPEDASVRARLAEVHRARGDHERAMEFARQALIREPKTLNAYKVMMLSYLDRKQVSMAKLVALRALKIDESDPELYHTIGLILLSENDSAKARLQFQKAVEVRPDYLPAHMMLARMAMLQENYQGAEEHLRRVLQSNGNNAEAHLDLGVAYRGQGQHDKALQEYEIAERLNPELAAIYLNRGIILHRHKDSPEKALDYYKKYLLLAGGAVALPPEAPVFGLMREAEQIIQAKSEAKRMEDEAKKLELAQKAQQTKLKEAEERENPHPAKPPKTAAKGSAKSAGSHAAPAKVSRPISRDEQKDEPLDKM
jgi:tetratricopeptide (TPR) repeat protein